jgi:hypothetical protein
MHIKYLSSFILSLLLISSAAYAQENFQPGYIISANQDTLRGFIDYGNWSENPEQITFKNTPISETIVHGVDDIMGFFVNNETYVKATVQRDMNPTRIDVLAYSPIPKYEKQTAFLQVLYQGPKSLYFFKDIENRVNLYVKSDIGEYVLLVKYRYKTGANQVVTNTQYKEQLKAYLNDCPVIEKKIKLLTYSEISMVKLFKEYYSSCSKESVVAQYVPKKVGYEFGVVAGATLTALRFTGNIYMDGFAFNSSLRPAGGVYMNIRIPGGNRPLSIYNELMLDSYSVESHNLSQVVGGMQSSADRQIGATYIKLNTMFRYLFPTGRTKLFFNGGISNGIAVSQINKERVEEITSSASIVHQTKLIRDTRRYETGWILGAGARFNKTSLEFRTVLSNGMAANVDLNSLVTRYSLLLSYQFF